MCNQHRKCRPSCTFWTSLCNKDVVEVRYYHDDKLYSDVYVALRGATAIMDDVTVQQHGCESVKYG